MSAVVAIDRHRFSAGRSGESAMRNDGFETRFPLRALRETDGMSDPERTVYLMERLGKAHYRGRGDTLGAAVQRVAADIGAPVSQAKRCWDRWKEMKDVARSVMIPFMLAYEDLCQRIEAKADEYERQSLQPRTSNDAVDQGSAPLGAGVARVAAREEA